MYFDDHYDPNEENDYDDSDNMDKSVSTVYTNTNKNSRRKWKNDIENTDPEYATTYRLVKRPISVGLKVDMLSSDSNGVNAYHSGKIVRINKHNYDILLDNGDRRNNVSNKYICFPHSVMKGVLTKISYYFTSLNPNITIRNAVNGSYERGYKTGSIDEDLFFKVTLATGEGGNKDSRSLFFHSPEQYERYFHCTVSVDTKERWNQKVQRIREKNME